MQVDQKTDKKKRSNTEQLELKRERKAAQNAAARAKAARKDRSTGYVKGVIADCRADRKARNEELRYRRQHQADIYAAIAMWLEDAHDSKDRFGIVIDLASTENRPTADAEYWDNVFALAWMDLTQAIDKGMGADRYYAYKPVEGSPCVYRLCKARSY